jgi:hypothetical protein
VRTAQPGDHGFETINQHNLAPTWAMEIMLWLVDAAAGMRKGPNACDRG